MALKQETVWKTVPGYEGRYEVSICGRVRSLMWHEKRRRKPRELVPAVLHAGHLRVHLYANRVCKVASVHRLVLLAFRGPPLTEDLQCAHLDGDPTNNALWNLEWVSPKENMLHRDVHLRTARGEAHASARLTESAVRQIRREYLSGRSLQGLGSQFGVSKQTIFKIVRGTIWKHVS